MFLLLNFIGWFQSKFFYFQEQNLSLSKVLDVHLHFIQSCLINSCSLLYITIQVKHPKTSIQTSESEISCTSSTATSSARSGSSTKATLISPGPMDKCIRYVTSFSDETDNLVEECVKFTYFSIFNHFQLRNIYISFSWYDKRCDSFRCASFYDLQGQQATLHYRTLRVSKFCEKAAPLQKIVLEKLAAADSICLTTGLQIQNSTMNSYLGVTAHYREGKLSYFLLNCEGDLREALVFLRFKSIHFSLHMNCLTLHARKVFGVTDQEFGFKFSKF